MLTAPGTEAGDNRAIALVDGEHYPDVTRDALRYLEDVKGYRLDAVVFLGGTEKMAEPGSFSYRDIPVYFDDSQVEGLRRALADHRSSVVIDLSDEPVVGYAERFRLACEALASGATYMGSDFQFNAPRRPYLCDKPCIGVWGTGKRVGKTAVSAYLARGLADRGRSPCILTMGRGGPPEPELLSSPLEVTDAFLRCRVEEGCHAASDHFEDAMMAGVKTVGSRRCGGGMAGEPVYSNTGEGARLACSQECDILIFEGSGAAIPPVGVDAVLLVVSADQPPDYILGYTGPYRLLLSDLVLVTMCEDFLVSSEKLRRLKDGIQSVNPGAKVIKTVFRPRPLGDIEGSMAFLTSTASGPAVQFQAKYLEERYGATVVGTSSNLADRRRLEEELENAVGADVFVTELKAAGVDTVSFFAARNGKRLVYLENVPVPLEGNIDRELNYLEALAGERCRRRTGAAAH